MEARPHGSAIPRAIRSEALTRGGCRSRQPMQGEVATAVASSTWSVRSGRLWPVSNVGRSECPEPMASTSWPWPSATRPPTASAASRRVAAADRARRPPISEEVYARKEHCGKNKGFSLVFPGMRGVDKLGLVSHNIHMKRTNLVLQEDLLEEALRLGGERTYSRTVERALEDFVRRIKARRILELRGTGLWEGDLAEMRRDPRGASKKARGKRRAAP